MGRKHGVGRRSFEPLSRPSDIVEAMRHMPLVATQRANGPTLWALLNGREVTEGAARRLIEKGRVVPRDAGLLPGSPQTFVLAAEGQ